MSRTARVGLLFFGVVFCLVGLAAVWFITIGPSLNVLRSRAWPSTQATITSSRVERHESDDGASWSAEISFEYEVRGQWHTSDSWSFFSMNGSRSGANATVKKYPVGSRATCYYSERNPGRAVLDRSFHWFSLMGVLFLLFPVFGGGALYYAISGGRRRATPATSLITDRAALASGREKQPLAEIFGAEWEGPRRLKPETTRLGRVIGIGVFALLWNGFLAFFIFLMWSDRGGIGGMGICFALFLIPFVLVGLGTLAAFVHQLLSLANPTVEIALSNGAVVCGDSLDVAWEMTGNSARIRNLVINIEGREQARYTRGTNTYTDKEVFCTIEIANTSDRAEMQFGEQTISIPANTVPSLDAPNNKIIWSIKVQGIIPMWPDVNEEFEFRVKPLTSS